MNKKKILIVKPNQTHIQKFYLLKDEISKNLEISKYKVIEYAKYIIFLFNIINNN